MELKESVARQKQALLKTLSEAIKIRSVQEEAKPGMPFGEGPAKCLAYMLKVCEDMGFRTKNVDNYMGWAEIGEGDEMVAILGHLDVVPEGKGWDKDPYSGEVDDTNVYGRGAMDDKGPAIAALYGMKAIVDAGLPLKRRIRILFGTNEETGAADMDYYLEKAERSQFADLRPMQNILSSTGKRNRQCRLYDALHAGWRGKACPYPRRYGLQYCSCPV